MSDFTDDTASNPVSRATADASGNNIANTYAAKTELTGKVDLNAANLSTAGKSLISGLGMPSNRYIDLTLGANDTTYVAPANGWFVFRKSANAANQYVVLTNKSNQMRDNPIASFSTAQCAAVLPVKKGDEVTVLYTAAGVTNYFRFVYAEGEENV